MNKQTKIGLVGCGRISKKHFSAIERLDDLKLVAICDIDDDALRSADTPIDVARYKSYEELLLNLDVDLVVLCTPSGLHATQAITAAKYNKHVITEKPMATNMDDANRMVSACKKAGVHLFVVKQNRYNKSLQLLKKAIDSGRFGKIYLVTVNVFWTRPQEYYDSAEWRGTCSLDGGALMNQSSHYFDLLNWLIGPVSHVHAMTGTLARNIEVEDTAVVNVCWRGGTLGSINSTMLTYPHNMEGSITIIGESGTVKIGGIALNNVEVWKFKDSCNYDSYVCNLHEQIDNVYGNGHFKYYKNIVNQLNSDVYPEIYGYDGLKSLELIVASYVSSRDDKTVFLSLDK